jgi:hypothetical protein
MLLLLLLVEQLERCRRLFFCCAAALVAAAAHRPSMFSPALSWPVSHFLRAQLHNLIGFFQKSLFKCRRSQNLRSLLLQTLLMPSLPGVGCI